MNVNRQNIVSGSDTVLYDKPHQRGCTSFRIDVPATAGNGILVHVHGLHDTDEYIPIPVGGGATFRRGDRNLTQVVAQGEGGTSTGVTYGAVSKTNAGT